MSYNVGDLTPVALRRTGNQGGTTMALARRDHSEFPELRGW